METEEEFKVSEAEFLDHYSTNSLDQKFRDSTETTPTTIENLPEVPKSVGENKSELKNFANIKVKKK